jgi:hypothetical protein
MPHSGHDSNDRLSNKVQDVVKREILCYIQDRRYAWNVTLTRDPIFSLLNARIKTTIFHE